MRKILVLPALVLACATALAQPQPVAGESADPSARLRALLEASDEALLERNPIYALFRGDLRRAGQHGDGLSPAYVDAERRAAQDDLARLDAIPRDALPPADRVAYDTFRWSLADHVERHSPPASAVWPLLSVDHFHGWHLFFATLSSGEGVAPYRTVADYEHGLSRIEGFVAYLDRAIGRMREGLRAGVVLPRLLAQRVLEQFERQAATPVEASPYWGPIRRMPADIAEDDRRRLDAAYRAAIEQRLRPAFARMRDFLARDYLPAARTTVGISGVPGGAAYYEHLVRSNTTTGIGADEVHAIGLAEVRRITAGMQAVMGQVGFDGTLAPFFEHLRTHPRFAPASAQALLDGYAAIGRRVEAALPRLFAANARTPLEIRPTPADQAPTDAAARYTAGSLDTGRPGIFYVNTHDLPARPLWGMETMYLHEAVPGHHLQSSLAAENPALPKLLRHGGNTAYGEGWALYAESLGPELGLFGDPYQRFGHLNDEMLRAMRLVVDTGLHARGWSREQAIDYMLAHSAMSRTEAVAEVERYIAVPGQALAYKIGALTLQRLRRQAEQRLGARFDVREFHAQVLDTGSIPLAVLEAKIDAWVAQRLR